MGSTCGEKPIGKLAALLGVCFLAAFSIHGRMSGSPKAHLLRIRRGGIEYVLVCLPVKDGKSLVADSVKEVLEKGKFYPKPVLAAGGGSGAQCFAYEECDTDAKQRGVKLRRFSSQLKQS